MAAEACPTCFSADLVEEGGLRICQACGFHFEGFVEETHEFQAGVDTGRFRRRVRSVGKSTGAPDHELPVEELVACYCGCLQHMLQAQDEALQQLAAVSKATQSLLRRLWFAYLAQSNITQPRSARDLAANLKAARHSSDKEGPSPARATKPKLLKDMVREVLWKVLGPELLLAFCLLACWLGQEPVLPLDIVRWALAGQLPYLNLAKHSHPLVQQAKVDLPSSVLEPPGVPSAHKLLMMTARLAANLELQLPSPNAGLFLDRFTSELSLPQGLAAGALQLYCLHKEGTPAVHLERRAQSNPFVQLMALLIAVMKLVYGLDGMPRCPPAAVQPPSDWQSWAGPVMGALPDPSTYPLDPDEVTELPAPKLTIYLDYLRRSIGGANNAPSKLADAAKSLTSLAQLMIAPAFGMAQLPQSSQQASVPDGGVMLVEGPDGQAADGQYTIWAKHQSVTSGNVHPDYAAVVTVCAAYLWLNPLYLHTIVAELDTRIAEAEISL